MHRTLPHLRHSRPDRRPLTACTAGTAARPALGSQPKPQGSAADRPSGRHHRALARVSAPARGEGVRGRHRRIPQEVPQITVKLVKGSEDDQITQAVRGGTPAGRGLLLHHRQRRPVCTSGVFQDLTPVIKQDGIDLAVLSRRPSHDYTAVRGQAVRDAAARRRLRALLQQGA